MIVFRFIPGILIIHAFLIKFLIKPEFNLMMDLGHL